MKEYRLRVGVNHLNHEQWERFLWQINGGHGAGVPVVGRAQDLCLEDGRIETGYAELTGHKQGASAILDEFIPTLDAACERVRIDLSLMSYEAFTQLLMAVKGMTHREAVYVSVGEISIRDGCSEVEDVCIVLDAAAIGEARLLVAPLFP